MDETGRFTMDQLSENIKNQKLVETIFPQEFNYDDFYKKLCKYNKKKEKIKILEKEIEGTLSLLSSSFIYPEPSKELKMKLKTLQNSKISDSLDLIKQTTECLSNQSIIFKKIMISKPRSN